MQFNEAKVTQAAAYLLKLRGGRMKYIKLLKLLYLADRKAFLERGRTISTDCYVSMDNGPVLSVTYSLIQNEYRESNGSWASKISVASDFDVVLNDPEQPISIGELSEADIQTIEAVYSEYGHWNRWKLIDDVMHKLPEWHDPQGSMIPIEYTDILRASDLTLSEQKSIQEDIESLSVLDELLRA